MPASQPDSHNLGAIEQYLRQAAPNADLARVHAKNDNQLLLLRLPHVVVAFGLADASGEANFDAIYSAFKDYCASNVGHFRGVDIAFVFCSAAPIADSFCSRIETDKYFCRKFVIYLQPSLERAFGKLPFLALAPLEQDPIRPVSAQTFLQQAGLTSTLARHLVVPRQRGTENILQDCVAGANGAPRRPRARVDIGEQIFERPEAECVLKTITIENFRAYRQPQTFELGADVTLLYGPNGFGKTSFYDAIDFAITGGIGRLRYGDDDDRIQHAAQHLDSNDGVSGVVANFEIDGTPVVVERTVAARKRPTLNGKQCERKDVLVALTGSKGPQEDRVENLIKLFRATHLFSQEQQELTRDFSKDCVLPASIVARMLAFEDYDQARRKAEQVRAAADEIVVNARRAIDELALNISRLEADIASLNQSKHAASDLTLLAFELEKVREQLAELGLQTRAELPAVSEVQDWRAWLEARLNDNTVALAKLGEVLKDASALPSVRKEGETLRSERDNVQREGESLAETSAVTKHSLGDLQGIEAATRSDIKTTEEHSANIRWAIEIGPRFVELQTQIGPLQARVDDLTKVVSHHQSLSDASEQEAASHKELLRSSGQSLSNKQSYLTSVEDFFRSIPVWRDSEGRLSDIVSELDGLQTDDKRLGEEQRRLMDLLSASRRIEQVLMTALQTKRSALSRLGSLLTELKSHISDGSCLACGVDHGSREALQLRMEEIISRDHGLDEANELAQCRVEIEGHAALLASNQAEYDAIKEKRSRLGYERKELETLIGRIRDAASALGLSADLDAITDRTIEALNQTTGELNEMRLRHAATATMARDATDRLDAARQAIVTTNGEIGLLENQLRRVTDEINDIEGHALSRKVSLQRSASELDQELKKNEAKLAMLRAQLQDLELKLRMHRSTVSSVDDQLKEQRQRYRALVGSIATKDELISKAAQRFREFDLPDDVSPQEVQAQIQDHSLRGARINATRSSLLSLERALDAASTSAAVQQMAATLQEKMKRRDEYTVEMSSHLPWANYFDQVVNLLETAQSSAVQNFTRQYGPRTSLIQSRLRTVYGFDEIEIENSKTSIVVSTRRNGDKLRPTDYFSQSQQQTLLLGLFLTACSAQNWSSFTPIFLDDPITHFDDLNTYSFLDLIVGLVGTVPGRHQFVISTCDDKFLQFATQKFRHLGERAKIYKFSAIGAAGPVVEQLRTLAATAAK